MPAKSKDEAISGLLRETLATQALADRCPEPELLAAYLERSLDKDEARRFDLHFSQCSRCREQLALIAGAEESRKSEPEHAWLWDWRLFVATAAVLALVVYFGIRNPAHLASGTTTPLVAKSVPPEGAPQGAPPLPSAALVAPAESQAKRSSSEPGNSPSRLKVASPSVQPPAKKQSAGAEPKPTAGISVQSADEPAKDFRAQANEVTSAPALSPTASSVKQRQQSDAAPPAAAAPQPQNAAPGPETLAQEQQGAAAADSTASKTQTRTLDTASNSAKVQNHAPQETSGIPINGRAFSSLQNLEKDVAGEMVRTPNPQMMWRIADGPYIEHTTDMGSTWHRQALGANVEILAGSASSEVVCWIAGRNGTILLTTNALLWTKVSAPAPTDFIAVVATSADAATVTTRDGRKFATRDGGKTWAPQP